MKDGCVRGEESRTKRNRERRSLKELEKYRKEDIVRAKDRERGERARDRGRWREREREKERESERERRGVKIREKSYKLKVREKG